MLVLRRLITGDLLTNEQPRQEKTNMRARVIGYIPLDRGSSSKKSRVSHLVDVTRAKSDSDRLKKLVLAAKVFTHFDKSRHDSDIQAGAVSVLCSLLRSCSPLFIAKSKEVYWICKILHQLYSRCNEDRAKVSFCVDGSTLIINALEVIEINYRLGKKGDTKCLVVAQNLIDKLLSLACVPLVLIKRHEELMSSLVSNIHGATGRIVMLLSMRCLSILSQHKDNKQVLLSHPGLVRSVEIGSRHPAESVREESARIICNLAWDSRNKSQLVNYDEQGWAEMICASLKESSYTSKQYAIKTLSFLASEAQNKSLIVKHENGAIVEELKRLISATSSINEQVNTAAAELVGSLICRATASNLICCQPDFLMTLASQACGQNNNIAVPAARVIKKFSTYIHSDDHYHRDLLQALVTMSYGIHTEVLKLVVKAYAEQAECPHNRLKMISHKGLLSALTMLTGDEKSTTVRDLAQFVLNTLAADVAKAKGLGVNEVLSQVDSTGSRKFTRFQPRCYSPTSIIQFDFGDFDSIDCISSLV